MSDLAATVERVLFAERQGIRRKDEIDFICPSHPNTEPGPAGWNRGRDSWHCLSCGASGSTRDLAERIGVRVDERKPKDDSKIVATYDYFDLEGHLLYQAVRFIPKDFKQRRPDGKNGWIWNLDGVTRVLYRLPELVAATAGGGIQIYVPEGEKDVDRLRSLGLVATCNVGGAGKWRPPYSEWLRDCDVVFLEDNDDAGRKHCASAAHLTRPYARSVRVVSLPGLPAKGDISDWLNDGGTKEELEALVAAAPEWSPPATVTPDGFASSNAGQAELYAHLYGNSVRYDHQRGRWLVWNEHRWGRDMDGQIWRWAVDAARTRAKALIDMGASIEAIKSARYQENTGPIEAMLKQLRSIPPVADTGLGWDANPMLLGVTNGVINLATGEFRSGRRDDRVTKNIGVAYDKDATCPRWEQFLEEVFVDRSTIQFIQRAVGYSMTGSTKEQVWFLCHGDGANGKSTFLETIFSLLGGVGDDSYSADTSADTLMKQGKSAAIPADLAALAGKRYVICSESDSVSQIHASRVKGLVTGDPQTARFLRENFFTFIPVLKLWLGTNHLPRVSDPSDGFWRRVRLVHFGVKFEGEKRVDGMKEWFRENELPGILNWAIAGVMAWQRTGLRAPTSISIATLKYRNESDPLGEWKTDCCIIAPSERTTLAEVFSSYRAWCDRQGITERERFGRNSFLNLLKDQGFNQHRTTDQRYVIGIRPMEQWEKVSSLANEEGQIGPAKSVMNDASGNLDDAFEGGVSNGQTPTSLLDFNRTMTQKVSSIASEVNMCSCDGAQCEECFKIEGGSDWWIDPATGDQHCPTHHPEPLYADPA